MPLPATSLRPLGRHVMRAIALAAVVLPSALAAPAGAQPAARAPRLEASADVNDWEAYYERGVQLLDHHQQIEAARYFQWAEKLAPDRGEPFFADWVAFWGKDAPKYGRWLDDEREVLEDPEVIRSDSLRARALARNPLVYQGLELSIISQLDYLSFRQDAATLGEFAYAQGEWSRAIDQFGRAIQKGGKYQLFHYYRRALAFTAVQRLDSAQAMIQAMTDTLRAREVSKVVWRYVSKASLAYTLGRLRYARGDRPGAKAAFGEALVEDLTFHPAHEWLGQLALEAGDTATAVAEYRSALELAGGDPVLHWELARALGAEGNDVAAITELGKAIELAPLFADPYYSLALAYERQGDLDSALVAYRNFLAHASRTAPARPRVEARLKQLAANGIK